MWAELTPFDDKGRVLDQWDLRGGPKSRQATFKRLTKQASTYAGMQLSEKEACNWWLDELRDRLQEAENENIQVSEVTVLSKAFRPSKASAGPPTAVERMKNVDEDKPGPADAVKTEDSPWIEKVCHESSEFCMTLSFQGFTSVFHPSHYGGVELCIVVSYSKAGKTDLKKLAQILSHRASIKYQKNLGKRYENYLDAEQWYRKNYETFKNRCYFLRKKAKKRGWWDGISPDYHLKYSG